MLIGRARGHRWKPTRNQHTWARRYTGWPAPRDGPHGNGRALVRRAGESPIPTQHHPITARATASTHPSGMWFCPMPRCTHREGASLTGWSCFQSWVSHLRSVHLSTGAAPPDAWLDSHGLRVCLAFRESTPQGARRPGPRYFTAVLAAIDLGNTATPSTGTLATGRASPVGPGPGAPTGNSDLHTAQALEREQTWETLARILLFPRIALAAPARRGKATKSPRPSSVGSTAGRLLWTR